jgi:hypothetical protein
MAVTGVRIPRGRHEFKYIARWNCSCRPVPQYFPDINVRRPVQTEDGIGQLS